ncbi:MAG: hypothetical protein RL757_154 [Bacteroidota bacterium]|jgi:hypothetical protein
MNEFFYKELTYILEQMINDKVQLIHGGQIFNWDETRIPEIVQNIKYNLESGNNNIVKNIPIKNSDN